MPRRSNPVPKYSLHTATGQAFVKVPDGAGGRRFVYLGKYGSEESRAEYRRILAGLHTPPAGVGSPSPAAAVPPTVNHVLVAFARHALEYYRRADGKAASEIDELKRSLRPVRHLYGDSPAGAFGPKALAAVRQRMIDLGWCRTLINRRAERIRRVFRWAAAEELVPAAVYQSLRALPGLKKGRTGARESDPVHPVDPAHVAATLPHLRPPVRAMARLQELTGMRPGEACGFRFADLDRASELWVYRPTLHKTAHRGKTRVIPLGPKARDVLTAFLVGDHPPPALAPTFDPSDPEARLPAAAAFETAGRTHDADLLRDLTRRVELLAGCVVDLQAPLFSPARDREDRFRAMRAARRTKVPPSQRGRRAAHPKRTPAGAYNTHAYAVAVSRACERSGVPHWHPNQIRHTFATEVRRAYGAEAAQVLLGHSQLSTTEVYAERNLDLAARVAAERG